MATAYLTDGATTLAAASWSDATGFADGADLVISDGSQSIQTALNQSGLTNGINRLRILPGFSGNIGSGSESLRVDVDNSSSPRLEYLARAGSLFYAANGNSNVCTRLVVASGGSLTLTGGTITQLEVQAANRVTVNSSTVVTTAYINGGSGVIEYNATAITNLYMGGGNYVLRRAATTVTLGGGTLVVDVKQAATAATTINMAGGRLVLYAGNVTTPNLYAGSVDASKAVKPITLGGTNGVFGPGLNIAYNSQVTIDASVLQLGSLDRTFTATPASDPSFR